MKLNRVTARPNGSVKQTLLVRGTSLVVASSLMLQGCAVPMNQGNTGGSPTSGYDPCTSQLARNTGAVLGSVVGLVIGSQLSKHADAKVVGVLLGGALGAAIGSDVARRQCELQQVARKYNLDVVSAELKMPAPDSTGAAQAQAQAVGMTAAIVDPGGEQGQFLPGSDQLTPKAQQYFKEIAAQYSPAARKAALHGKDEGLTVHARLLVVGHTDDQEESARAAELSERRARTVALLLRQAGVPESSIWYQGAGETLPVADNRTEAGRARNRRVEISDFANGDVMTAYLESRVSTLGYFRTESERQGASSSSAAKSTVAATRPDTKTEKPAKRVSTEQTAGRSRSRPLTTAEKPLAGTTPEAGPNVGRPSESAAGSKHGNAALGSSPISSGNRERSPLPTGVVKSQPKPAAPSEAQGFDFHGVPYNSSEHVVRVGSAQQRGFSLISESVADDAAQAGSCVEDRPRVSRSVKSLRDGSAYKFNDYLPGMYGNAWVGMVNGHLVALSGVAVLKDGGMPAQAPTVRLYRDFVAETGQQRRADFQAVAKVNTYAGTEGVLYRVFMDGAAPIKCIDLALPLKAPFAVPSGRGFLFQERASGIQASSFLPRVPG